VEESKLAMLYLILLLLLLLMLMPAMNYDDKQYAFHAKNTLDMRRGGELSCQ